MLVKYDNKLNLLAFKGVSKLESDLFFSIIARLKEKKSDRIEISFNELTEFIDKNLTNDEISNLLDKGLNKIVQTYISWETDSTITKFTIFKLFKINKEKATLEVSLNEVFLYILNNFESGFTIWELAEFSSLGSKYSKTLYRLLKQFKYTGLLKMDWAYFFEILDIPKTYRIIDIDTRILKPAIKELTETSLFKTNPIFKNLSYEKEYYAKRGRPIKSITFIFMPEKRELNTLEDIKQDKVTNIAKNTKKAIYKQKIDRDKELIKKQELKTRSDFFGNQVTDLNAYINRHFKVKSKFGGYDSCKIKELYQTQDNKIQGTAINQENGKIFKLKFDSIDHLKNSLKL